MKNFTKPLTIILSFILVFVFVLGYMISPAKAAPVEQETPTNKVLIDVTYNPEAKTFSAAGFSYEQLKAAGVPDVFAGYWEILSKIDGATLKYSSDNLDIFLGETKLGSIKLDKEARATIYKYIDAFSGQAPLDQARVEEWLSKSDLEIALRKSADLSKKLELNLSTPLNIKISEDGQIAVEGFKTGSELTPETVEMIKQLGIQNAAMCWTEGVIKTKVNGSEIPQITLYNDGLTALDKAFNLGIGDISQLFEAQIGASLATGEEANPSVECGN